MVEIKFKKKDLWLISAVMIFVIAVGYVIAINSNDYQLQGHDFSEIQKCSANKILKSDVNGNWICGDDISGSGGIANISAGTGIILTPNPITSTGSVAVNTNAIQARVSTGCGAGQAIQSITSTGSVICQAVAPIYCMYSSTQYSEGAVCCVGSERKYCNLDGSWSTDIYPCSGSYVAPVC